MSDLLADIAGFSIFIVYSAWFLTSIWNYKDLERYLVTSLYRKKKDSQDTGLGLKFEDRSEPIKTAEVGLAYLTCELIPDFLKCCCEGRMRNQ